MYSARVPSMPISLAPTDQPPEGTEPEPEPEDADAERSGIARSLEGIYEWWKDPSTSWRDPSTWHDPRNPARLEGEEEGGEVPEALQMLTVIAPPRKTTPPVTPPGNHRN